MFALTRIERARQQYIRDVRRLVNDIYHISPKEVGDKNATWQEWVTLARREWRDLRDLLNKADVSDAFKARALAILFAPRLDWAPFAWPVKQHGSYLDLWFHKEEGRVTLTDLSPRLGDFALLLILLEIDSVLAYTKGHADEDMLQTFSSYNRLILQALAITPDGSMVAEELFKRYQLNDPVPYWNMDTASGYNPFGALMSANVPEKWKRLADEEMRTIVRAEQEGRATARESWEGALTSYADRIQLKLYDKTIPYGPNLFAEQIAFILGLPGLEGRRVFHTYHVYKILALLAGQPYELRHRFARHVVLADHGSHGEFSAYSEDTLAAARSMREEFGNNDAELYTHLDTIIAAGEERARERQARARAKTSDEAAVLAKMR